MENKFIVDYDFESLYPNQMKSFNNNDLIKELFRQRNLLKLQTERKKKLEMINKIAALDNFSELL